MLADSGGIAEVPLSLLLSLLQQEAAGFSRTLHVVQEVFDALRGTAGLTGSQLN